MARSRERKDAYKEAAPCAWPGSSKFRALSIKQHLSQPTKPWKTSPRRMLLSCASSAVLGAQGAGTGRAAGAGGLCPLHEGHQGTTSAFPEPPWAIISPSPACVWDFAASASCSAHPPAGQCCSLSPPGSCTHLDCKRASASPSASKHGALC